MDTSKVTRVEVIDEHGRAWTTYNASNVKIDLQDNDRTLKIFLASNKPPTIDPVEIIEKEKKIAQLFKDDKYADGYWDALHELLHKFNPSSHV